MVVAFHQAVSTGALRNRNRVVGQRIQCRDVAPTMSLTELVDKPQSVSSG